MDHDNSIAMRLKVAREAKGLSIETLARELKTPRAIIEAMERGEWSRLGAPVFAKSLIGRYAERLGVIVDLNEITASMATPELRPQVVSSPLGRFAEFSARHAAYLGGTLLVVPAVYTLLNLTATGPVRVRPLDPAPIAAELDGPMANGVEAAPAPVSIAPADEDVLAVEAGPPSSMTADPAATAPAAATPAPLPMPVAASMAGTGAAPRRELELRFTGDSWIEVFGRNGEVLDRVLARNGEERRFPSATVGRVTIGNVEATEVVLDGSRVNLDAVRAANVARFALSSDGSIEAVAR